MHINLKMNALEKPSSCFQNPTLGFPEEGVIRHNETLDTMRLLLSHNQSIIKQIDSSLKKTHGGA